MDVLAGADEAIAEFTGPAGDASLMPPPPPRPPQRAAHLAWCSHCRLHSCKQVPRAILRRMLGDLPTGTAVCTFCHAAFPRG